jgi:hypothetical protein
MIGMINGMKVIENPLCLQSWQLEEWTKELMGEKWVAEFDEWAKVNLPKQPACYFMNVGIIGEKILVAHPEIIRQLKNSAQRIF